MKDDVFNKKSWAQQHARTHLKADPGVVAIYFLPHGASEREIRLLEVNDLIPEWRSDSLEPIDFGIDNGLSTAHTLLVIDVTPKQWVRIEKGKLPLPAGWSLEGKVTYLPKTKQEVK